MTPKTRIKRNNKNKELESAVQEFLLPQMPREEGYQKNSRERQEEVPQGKTPIQTSGQGDNRSMAKVDAIGEVSYTLEGFKTRQRKGCHIEAGRNGEGSEGTKYFTISNEKRATELSEKGAKRRVANRTINT